MDSLGIEDVMRLFRVSKNAASSTLMLTPGSLKERVLYLIKSSLGVRQQEAEVILRRIQSGQERVYKFNEAAQLLELDDYGRTKQTTILGAARPIIFVASDNGDSKQLRRYLHSRITDAGIIADIFTKGSTTHLGLNKTTELLNVSATTLRQAIVSGATPVRAKTHPTSGRLSCVLRDSLIEELREAIGAVPDSARINLTAEELYDRLVISEAVLLRGCQFRANLLAVGDRPNGSNIYKIANNMPHIILFHRLPPSQALRRWPQLL